MIIYKNSGNNFGVVSNDYNLLESSGAFTSDLQKSSTKKGAKKLNKNNILFLQAIGMKICPHQLS